MRKATFSAKKKGAPGHEVEVEKKITVKNKTKAKKVNPIAGSGLGRTSYTQKKKRAT